MKALVVVIFILAIGSSYCQISQRDRTTIINLLRPPCSESNGEHNYFTYFNCTNCIPDSSDIYPGLTEGAVYRNEYVLHHHPISVKNDQELLKYIRNKAVTNEEYLAFEDWVRDSLAMEAYFNMVDEPNFDAKFMQRDKKKTYYRNGLEIPAGYVYREDIRPDISFDHSKIFAFDDPMYMPYIAHMYLPYPQRFYNSREFDKRKFYYHYTARFEKLADLPYDSVAHYFPKHLSSSSGFGEIELSIPVLRDEFVFAKKSAHYRDLSSVRSILGDKLFRNEAVCGIEGFQADAFCDWKSKMLQQELDNAGLEYEVVVTLPSESDVRNNPLGNQELVIATVDMTDRWRISNSEYREFATYVRDSINREFLYFNLKSDEAASNMLLYRDYYFGEGELEFVEYDKADRDMNRALFYFDPKNKIKRTNEVDSLLIIAEKLPLAYRYFEYNASNRAIEGNLIQNVKIPGMNGGEYMFKKLAVNLDSIPYSKIGKDLQIGSVNLLGDANAILSHMDYSRFIDRKTRVLSVSDPKDVPVNDSIRHELGYEEALAYYNWRYPIQKASKDSNWEDFLYPSKEQYEAIRSGEVIVITEAHTVYPTPTFRYVVHIYPKSK